MISISSRLDQKFSKEEQIESEELTGFIPTGSIEYTTEIPSPKSVGPQEDAEDNAEEEYSDTTMIESTQDPEDVNIQNIVHQLQVGPLWNAIHPSGGVDRTAKDVVKALSRTHSDIVDQLSGTSKYRKYFDSLKSPSILQKLSSYRSFK